MTIADRLREVRARIERAANDAKRDPASVKLVCVSKTKPAAAIREAYAAGERRFGESYAKELAQKAAELVDLSEIEWHFIGHLQSNKSKLIAEHAHVMQTVDSPSLARELARRVRNAGRASLEVMIEVNVGGEAQKHGVTGSEIEETLAAIQAEDVLRARGLMTIPPDDLDAARKAFAALASLRNLHGGPSVLPELSMGMSSDLEVAVAAGATLVRIGTAIFGDR